MKKVGYKTSVNYVKILLAALNNFCAAQEELMVSCIGIYL